MGRRTPVPADLLTGPPGRLKGKAGAPADGRSGAPRARKSGRGAEGGRARLAGASGRGLGTRVTRGWAAGAWMRLPEGPEAVGASGAGPCTGGAAAWPWLLGGGKARRKQGDGAGAPGAVLGGGLATQTAGLGAMCVCFKSPDFLMCSEITDLSLFSKSLWMSDVKMWYIKASWLLALALHFLQ